MKRPVVGFLIIAFVASSGGSAFADTLAKPETNCTRTYIYRNRTFPVDSSRKPDGEGLRSVLKKNSQSEYLLNRYQANMKTSKIPAFFGTAGAIFLVGGLIYTGSMSPDQHLGKRDTRIAVIAGGVSIVLGSYFFGRYLINSNDDNLENAVTTYNGTADPREKIQVDFTPVETGSGGEIKTIVPF